MGVVGEMIAVSMVGIGIGRGKETEGIEIGVIGRIELIGGIEEGMIGGTMEVFREGAQAGIVTAKNL